MAVIIEEYMTDDLAAREDPRSEVRADRTVRFSVDGEEYEIDLTNGNAEELLSVLRPYREAGRRIRRRPPRRRDAARQVNTEGVRAWARENGYDVKDRGRVPADIVRRYEASALQPA